jgi:ankyrin repeat protein
LINEWIAGADINNAGVAGKTPLAEAACRGNVRMMDFLLSKGADPEAPNAFYKNGNAVVAATVARQPRSVEALIRVSPQFFHLLCYII